MSSAIHQVQPLAGSPDAEGTSTAATASKSGRRKKPRKKDLLNQADLNQVNTTVMIQGLPWTYQNNDLLKLLEWNVGAGTFDFLYMPWNLERNTNSGRAFVNFTSSINAARCASVLHGQTFQCGSKTIKPCVVAPAYIQGLEKNLEYFRYRAVSDPKNPHQPLVFKAGVHVSFQMAVQKLCPKKSKKGRMPNNGEDPTKTQENEQPDVNMLHGYKNVPVQALCPKKSKKGPIPTHGEDLTKMSQGKEQPDINKACAYQNLQHLNFQVPPGLPGLEELLNLDPLLYDMSSDHDSTPIFQEDENQIFAPSYNMNNGPALKPTCQVQEEQIPTPSFCHTWQKEDARRPSGDCLFTDTPWSIFENDVLQPHSDNGSSSTTASEDERTTTRTLQTTSGAVPGFAHGYGEQACTKFTESRFWPDLVASL